MILETLICRVRNIVRHSILKVDQDTIVPFIWIAIILIIVDFITTFVGVISWSCEEMNVVSLKFMAEYGNFYGLLVSIIGKVILILLPWLIYKANCIRVDKDINALLYDIPLKNIYFVLYKVFIIVAIITTSITDINNMTLIIKGMCHYG